MITIKKINNEVVHPVRYGGEETDNRPIMGKDLFNLYDNILIVARKGSGKTNVLNKIVKSCANRSTTVIIFSSTHNSDNVHKAIKRYCKMKGIPYIGYDSLVEDGVNILDTLIKGWQKKAKEEAISSDDERESEQVELKLFDSSSESDSEETRPSKYRAPEYIIIFDDMSKDLRNPAVETLIKKNRHYLCKTISSVQYPFDMTPAALANEDVALIFRGEPLDKLTKLYNDFDLTIPFDTFIKLYNHATKEPYNFLYIDIKNEKFRRNFNHEYSIKIPAKKQEIPTNGK